MYTETYTKPEQHRWRIYEQRVVEPRPALKMVAWAVVPDRRRWKFGTSDSEFRDLRIEHVFGPPGIRSSADVFEWTLK